MTERGKGPPSSPEKKGRRISSGPFAFRSAFLNPGLLPHPSMRVMLLPLMESLSTTCAPFRTVASWWHP